MAIEYILDPQYKNYTLKVKSMVDKDILYVSAGASVLEANTIAELEKKIDDYEAAQFKPFQVLYRESDYNKIEKLNVVTKINDDVYVAVDENGIKRKILLDSSFVLLTVDNEKQYLKYTNLVKNKSDAIKDFNIKILAIIEKIFEEV